MGDRSFSDMAMGRITRGSGRVGSGRVGSGLGFCEFWWVGLKFSDLKILNNPSQQREMQSVEEELNKYKLLRLPSCANKNPLYFWRDNASD